jgi:hypothetical protein
MLIRMNWSLSDFFNAKAEGRSEYNLPQSGREPKVKIY